LASESTFSFRQGFPALALALTLLPGCDLLPPEYEKYWVQAQREAIVLLASITGTKLPGPRASASPSPSSSPAVVADGSSDYGSQNARNAKANAEFLHEVYRVVFNREPKDRSEFGNLVDSMNQGASIEGMYNGFTHSADYRKLELINSAASPEALRTFGEELALLESELPTPTDPETLVTPPGEEPGSVHAAEKPKADGVNVIEYGKPAQPGVTATPAPTASAVTAPAGGVMSPEVKALSERYIKAFVGTSIFTLKRVIGDEALRVLSAKKDSGEKLALWYSRWVGHMASRNVDFGIALRNNPDEQFHYKWALTAGEDKLKWEVLNRLHRVLNDANRQKQ
jgi:hypothetical protein